MPFFSWVAFALAAATQYAHAVNIDVSSEGGAPVSPMQYGLFFEDINQSGDGGLYAELLINRAFQGNYSVPDSINTAPWYPSGDATLTLVQNDTNPISDALPYSVAVNGTGGQIGLSQGGFWGINVQQATYTGSFYVKGDYNGQFNASLHSTTPGANGINTTFGSNSSIDVNIRAADGFKKIDYTIDVTQAAPDVNNTFTLAWNSNGTTAPLQLGLISLFPPTYKNRPNGLRVDLAEQLEKLSPSFLRFPGGNNLEGGSSWAGHWQWNNTIGPLKDRAGRGGATGYWQSDGLGLDEYFGWCEDMDLEPILAIWAGFYLSGEEVGQGDLDLWVQDAMNELEYILGDESTPWGGARCANGHPEPYKLNYVEVGNEDNLNGGLDTYRAYRYQAFEQAIKQKYPEIVVIASTQELEGDEYGTGNAADYHQYTRPDYFVNQSSFFDNNNTDHQILIGEYAMVQNNLPPYPNGSLQTSDLSPGHPNIEHSEWIGTVSEAVFLLGAERNAAKIMGAAYAPLFENINAHTWTPDLIEFTADPAGTIESTSYQLFQALSNSRMTQTRAANVTDQPGAPGPASDSSAGPVYWAAGSNTITGSEIVKIAVYNATTSSSSADSNPSMTTQGSGSSSTASSSASASGTSSASATDSSSAAGTSVPASSQASSAQSTAQPSMAATAQKSTDDTNMDAESDSNTNGTTTSSNNMSKRQATSTGTATTADQTTATDQAAPSNSLSSNTADSKNLVQPGTGNGDGDAQGSTNNAQTTSSNVNNPTSTSTSTPQAPSGINGNNQTTTNSKVSTNNQDSSIQNGQVPITVTFDGVSGGTSAQLTVMSAPDPLAMNTAAGTSVINTQVTQVTADENGAFTFNVPDLSVAILETQPKGGQYGGAAGGAGYGGCKAGGQRGSYNWQGWLQGGQEGTGCSA
ncbi:MAG: hypothetical protein Q9162_000262 [Coniocarpon cinnabarinum]